jgi:hypothetical protein
MEHIPKYKIPVRIALLDDDSVLGVVFVRQEQRVIDMLCDQRPFFPVNAREGVLVVNKSAVIKVEVLEKEFVLQNSDSFPDFDVQRDFDALARRRPRNSMDA